MSSKCKWSKLPQCIEVNIKLEMIKNTQWCGHVPTLKFSMFGAPVRTPVDPHFFYITFKILAFSHLCQKKLKSARSSKRSLCAHRRWSKMRRCSADCQKYYVTRPIFDGPSALKETQIGHFSSIYARFNKCSKMIDFETLRERSTFFIMHRIGNPSRNVSKSIIRNLSRWSILHLYKRLFWKKVRIFRETLQNRPFWPNILCILIIFN